MKKLLGLAVSVMITGQAWGQAAATSSASSSLRVSTAVEAPSSSVDLLKQSAETSTVAGTADSARPAQPAEPAVPPAASASNPAASSAPAVSVPKTPSSAVPAATPAGKPANSSAMLSMPLEMGGTSQTVQTAVEPVKKTLSPKAAKRVAQTKRKRASVQQQKAAVPTALEKDIEKSNALLPASAQASAAEEEELSEEEAAADAELEYAVRMLEQSKQAAQSAGRKIPPSASQNKPKTVPAPNKKFNPNAFRPGVTWQPSKSTHFDIYTQKRSSGISSSNMSMTFESAYQTLRRFIPWMMSSRVRVFVYQDHDSYLRHEPNAKAWTRALAYPTRGEIVVYDEPGKNQELKEVFTHELTHIFTQQFFDKHKTGRIMTPNWLDEGLAVLLEDQAYNGMKGGPWANDFKNLNFQRDPSETVASFGSSSMFGSSAKRLTSKRPGKPVYFTPFEEFMDEGSLAAAEGRGKTEEWYFQAYSMVRFLLNPAGGASPSNRMQFQQLTTLMAEGEPVRNPSTGFLMKDSRGKTVYQPYSAEKALGRAYRYNNVANFEDAFWRWAGR
ncbi:MAG: DUF2268 domain-containing putative Zn-dependent protease [Elusimicrobia bacterium]|nr:DUF2268 domain-containing putative Zn-dependent protease [Elusimicrobiota bacterium]MDY6039769.1 DUF2268 domain-containing putative Zn-dependent protease [Elusimicrobiaceae bacterium]